MEFYNKKLNKDCLNWEGFAVKIVHVIVPSFAQFQRRLLQKGSCISYTMTAVVSVNSMYIGAQTGFRVNKCCEAVGVQNTLFFSSLKLNACLHLETVFSLYLLILITICNFLINIIFLIHLFSLDRLFVILVKIMFLIQALFVKAKL